MTHDPTYLIGSDARNHIAQCTCSWSFSSTYKGVRAAFLEHSMTNSPYAWTDPKRKFEKDAKKAYFVGKL